MWNFLRRLLGGRPAEPPAASVSERAAVAGRKRAESDLRDSEEHFEQLVAGVRDYAIFLMDRHGTILTWNAGAERVKGYRPEEIVGRHFSTFYPPEAVAIDWPAHELRVAAETGKYEEEGWRVRKDGSQFWAHVVITALRGPAGEVRGYLKITRDLTDRKQTEERLRQSEQRFRLLVEQVRDYAIFMLDPEGRVATWNAGAERIKGYKADEIIGRHFSTFYPQEAVDRGWPAEELRRATAEGRIEDEGWRVRKDGSRFWANVVITALRDQAGTLRGFAKVTRDLTDRKQAEEAARRLLAEEAARKAAEEYAQEIGRQKEQLRVTLASIGDAVIVTDAAGVVTFLNPVAAGLTGWPLQEAAGQPLDRVFPLINEETRRPVENPVGWALRERAVVALANHTALVARDGREVPVEDSAALIRGPDGVVAGAVLVFRDVTKARRAAEARRRLAAIVESSDDAIIGKDLNALVTSWNRGAERLYGYAAEEAVGRSLAMVFPPDRLDELAAIMERIKRGEYIEHYETVRVRKDGTRFDASVTISPIRDADGKVTGASKIARDITARKRQEAALRFLADASKALGELLDVASTLQAVAALSVPRFADWCAVDLVGEDGTLRRVAAAHADPAKTELAGDLARRYPPGPTTPRGPVHVLRTGRAELADVTDEMLTPVARDDEHLRLLQGLGLRSYVCVPLTARGRTTGALTFATGESGRHFGPEDLRVAEDLAHRVAVAVENVQLYQALREEDRRKDEFLALLAHELRNPLAPLRNGLQVLRLAGTDPRAVEQTRPLMERQLHHLVRLVDDLLDVSRISRGKIVLRKERITLAAVVRHALDVCEQTVKQHGHELTVALPAEPVYVDADRTRLAQAVCNLLNNAAKYSDPGGQIWLTAGREGDGAVIRVKDTGVGIPPQMLPKVFEMFTQVDRTLERSQGGLG
ncbi:MAG TPA: PAS domain S-box protein, partial [Gemmataceae bacterium]